MTVNYGGTYGSFYQLYCDISESGVNTTTNQSVVTAHIYMNCSNNAAYFDNTNPGANVVIDGTQFNFAGNYSAGTGTHDLGIASKTITHNSDGTKSITVSAYHNANNGPGLTSASESTGFTLTTIPRYAVIDGGPKFDITTDEEIKVSWHADRSCDYITWWSTAYDGGGHHDTPASGQGWWNTDLHNLKSGKQYDFTVGVRNAASSLWTISGTVYATTKTQTNFVGRRVL